MEDRRVQRDDLAVADSFIRHRSQRLSNGRVPPAEILVVARPGMDTAACLERYCPETIEPQFVQPTCRPLAASRQALRAFDKAGFGFLVLHPGINLRQSPLEGNPSICGVTLTEI
jgi:hypothetical protein